MRILFITQWFSPEPQFKGLPFALELKRRGHQVTVLTGIPNYPGGKVYPGYRVRPLQREVMEGVPVIRAPLYPSHDRSAVGRALNYISFAAAASLVVLGCPEVDVAYVYHPPATIGWPALVLKWLRRIPCVYDVQDLWPDTLAATGMMNHRMLLSLVGAWSNFVYGNVDHAVVLSPGFKARLEERGVSARSVSVIYNWSPDWTGAVSDAQLSAEEQRLLAGRFTVLFAGNMGAAQGLGAVLDAAALVRIAAPRILFVFAGGGVAAEELKQEVARRKLHNVRFLPRRPANAMSSLLAAADALLVHLRDDPLFEITIPSKTQTYLAAGRPIVMGVRGDAARLVEAAEAGVCCQPSDPNSIAKAVLHLHAMGEGERAELGRRGQEFYRRYLDMPGRVDEFEVLFRRVADAASDAPAKVI